MNLSGPRNNIRGALKELLAEWERTTQYWDDAKSRKFAERYIDPLEAKTQAAATAMEDMNELLSRAKRECE